MTLRDAVKYQMHKHNNFIITFSVPLKLVREGEYNLNEIKEIQATDSFLGLHEAVRGCQFVEPYHNCTTRHYKNTLLEKCGCLPFNIRVSDNVNM